MAKGEAPKIEDVPALTPAFEQTFKLSLKQENAERAALVLVEAMEAECARRTTVMSQVVFKGEPVTDVLGEPVMEPRDSYETVPDHPTRVRAAELAMAYLHGFPVKRSATIEAKGFLPLDVLSRLRESPVFQEQNAEKQAAATEIAR